MLNEGCISSWKFRNGIGFEITQVWGSMHSSVLQVFIYKWKHRLSRRRGKAKSKNHMVVWWEIAHYNQTSGIIQLYWIIPMNFKIITDKALK